MSSGPAPSFDLAEMQALILPKQWFATWDAVAHAGELRLDAELDIAKCVLALDATDFYKSMPSTSLPGTWQDVYRTTYEGRKIYVKLRLLASPTKKLS